MHAEQSDSFWQKSEQEVGVVSLYWGELAILLWGEDRG